VRRISIYRVLAVAQKEARYFRRRRSVVVTLLVLPLMFLVEPLVNIFLQGPGSPVTAVRAVVGASFLLLLLIPVIVPSAMAAYAVIGEREQGTLEPLLTTPVSREEILLGKALVALVPSVIVSYLMIALVAVCAALFAPNRAIPSMVLQAPLLLGEVLFVPLLAAWSIWVGTAMSTRSGDVRTAQQLGTLASLPPVFVMMLVLFQVLAPGLGLTLGFALGLLILDVLLWRVVSAMFDRERLITGRRMARHGPSARTESSPHA
jgi:ABC-type Na+ efflux pump permease subunit